MMRDSANPGSSQAQRNAAWPIGLTRRRNMSGTGGDSGVPSPAGEGGGHRTMGAAADCVPHAA